MDQLHGMRVFVAVADGQGFAAAARHLSLSPPAVTRAVSALEAHLGVQLLRRTTRSVRVTDAGQRYLDDARRILADISAADEAAAGINAAPRGLLAVTAPVLFGRLHVMPAIVDYLGRFPEADVSAVFVDRVVNLVDEGLDVGIRIGELPDSSLRALRVGSIRRVLCASPKYLKRHGHPQSPGELMRHRIVASSAGDSDTHGWRFVNAGREQIVRVRPRLQVTTNDAALAAARDGFGITRLLSYQVERDVASGAVEVLLQSFEPRPMPVHIVHREGRYASVKVRAFVDLMAAHLRSNRALNAPR